MTEQEQQATITTFLEGMAYRGRRPSVAEGGDIARHLLAKGMVEGTHATVATQIHTHIRALDLERDATQRQERGPVRTRKSIEKAEDLNRMLFSTSGRVEYEGRNVVSVLALEGDRIRLFFDEMDTADPEKYTDVPYNTYLRRTR